MRGKPGILICFISIFTCFTLALPQISLDDRSHPLQCTGTVTGFAAISDSLGSSCQALGDLVTCCHNLAFINCDSSGYFVNQAMSPDSQAWQFCASNCQCQSAPVLGSDGPSMQPDGQIEARPTTSAPVASATDRSGPDGISCQKWNAMLDANPAFAEGKHKIEPCPPVATATP